MGWCRGIHAPIVDYQGGSGSIKDAIAGHRAVIAGSKGGTQGLANLLSWKGARGHFGEGIISINSALLLATEKMTWPTDPTGRKVPIVFLMHPGENEWLGNDLGIHGRFEYLSGVPDLDDFASTRINHNLLSQGGPACIVHMPRGTQHVLNTQQVETVLPQILEALSALHQSLEGADPAHHAITSENLQHAIQSQTGLQTSPVPRPSGRPSQRVQSHGADPFAKLATSVAVPGSNQSAPRPAKMTSPIESRTHGNASEQKPKSSPTSTPTSTRSTSSSESDGWVDLGDDAAVSIPAAPFVKKGKFKGSK